MIKQRCRPKSGRFFSRRWGWFGRQSHHWHFDLITVMAFQLFRKRGRPFGQQTALFAQHFWFESNYTSKGFFSFFEQKSDFFKNLSLRVCSDKAICCYFDRFGMHGDFVIFFHFFYFFVKKWFCDHCENKASCCLFDRFGYHPPIRCLIDDFFLDFHEKIMPAASLFKKATNSLFWRHAKWVKKIFFPLFWTKKRFWHRCSNKAICCFFHGFWSSSEDFMNFSWNLIKIMKNSLSRGTAHRRQGSTLYTLQTLYPIDFSLGRIEEV